MVDMRAVPQRLEQRVGEAQHHQVLHRLFAEIVVDAIDLPLGEHLADRLVDRARRSKVLAQRLFQHQPRHRRHQLVAPEVGRGRAEQIRRRRQVEHPHHRLPVLERRLQRPEGVGLGGIHADVRQALGEAAPDVRTERLALGRELDAGLFDQLDEIVRTHVAARDGDDLAIGRQAVVAVQFVERGEQLALRQVAAAAEHDHVERFGDQGVTLGTRRRHFHVSVFGAAIQVHRIPHRPLEFSRFRRDHDVRTNGSPGLGALPLSIIWPCEPFTATSQQPQINMPVRDGKHSFAALRGAGQSHVRNQASHPRANLGRVGDGSHRNAASPPQPPPIGGGSRSCRYAMRNSVAGSNRLARLMPRPGAPGAIPHRPRL